MTCSAAKTTTTAPHLGQIRFLDARHGYAAGGATELHILTTADGGASWKERVCDQPGGVVTFVDPDYGWMVRFGGVIMATTDAGATWTRQQPPAYTPPATYRGCCGYFDLGQVQFVDRSHGWATSSFCAGMVIATSDGGAHWHVQHDCEDDIPPWGVSMGDVRHGLASYDDRYSFTQDGGASWITGPAPGPGGGVTVATMIDDTHAWMLRDHEVFASNDGGSSWEHRGTTPPDNLGWLFFVDAEHGWASGVEGSSGMEGLAAIVATSDGGRTWTRQSLGDGAPSSVIVTFADQDHGWATGSFTGVSATTDGGATWTQQLAPRT